MTAPYDVLPAALDLPTGFDRHHPTPAEQRCAVLALAEPARAGDLEWPELVEYLFALGRSDVPLGRLTEGHVDALRILREAGASPTPGAAYGVWASRSRASGIRGRREGATWVLEGTLRFASGAGVLDRALVPVWLSDRDHVLLDLDVSAWLADDSTWRTRAMELSRSHQYDLAGLRTDALEVGGTGFYLDRPGFFPGGVGVAAVWVGSAARLVDLLEAAVPAHHRSPGHLIRLGRARSDLATSAAVCRDAAARLPQLAPETTRAAVTLARTGAAGCVRRILEEVRAVAGAGALAFDEDLTRAVDDLTLYVAQLNADGDAQWLGGLA